MEPAAVDRWRPRITSNEVPLLTPALRVSAQFLMESCNEDIGWGIYKGMPLDLGTSALALDALEACGQSDFESKIWNSRVALKAFISEHILEFDAVCLGASLRILSAFKHKSEEHKALVESLLHQLQATRNGIGWGVPNATIPLTGDILIGLGRHPDEGSVLIASVADGVIEQQNQDGGWPIKPDTQSSLQATARAVLGLSAIRYGKEKRYLTNSAEYFRRYLAQTDWISIIKREGLQTAALVLAAVSHLETFPYESILLGIEALYDQRNADGAWGESKGGVSNIEATATCVLSLCASGSNRQVPSRLALAAIQDATSSLDQAQRDLNQLRNDIRSRASKETKAIIIENDRLSKKVVDLEEEKKILIRQVNENERRLRDLQMFALRRSSGPLEQESIVIDLSLRERVLLYVSRLNPWVLSVLSFTVVAVWIISTLRPNSIRLLLNYPFITGLISAVLVGFASFFFYSRREARKRASVFGSPNRLFFLRRFPNLARDWPPSVREEFLYQLIRLTDTAPGFDSERRESMARSLAYRYAKRPEQVDELRILLDVFWSLSFDERAKTLDELRGTIAAP
jgi:hypothetical protein